MRFIMVQDIRRDLFFRIYFIFGQGMEQDTIILRKKT